MFYKVHYSIYPSKLATIVSMLQSSVWICFAVFFPIFNIPSFICLFCDVDAVTIGTLFGVLGVASFISSILFCIYVDAKKINDYVLRKRNKRKDKKTIKEVEQVYEKTVEAIRQTRNTLYAIYQAYGVVLPEEQLLEIASAVMDAPSCEEMHSILFSHIPAILPSQS